MRGMPRAGSKYRVKKRAIPFFFLLLADDKIRRGWFLDAPSPPAPSSYFFPGNFLRRSMICASRDSSFAVDGSF